MVGLCAPIGDDEIAGVLHRDVGRGKVDGAAARVPHLRLRPARAQRAERARARLPSAHPTSQLPVFQKYRSLRNQQVPIFSSHGSLQLKSQSAGTSLLSL